MRKELEKNSNSGKSANSASEIGIEDKREMEKYQYKLSKMDRKLKRINFRMNFHVDVLSFELTGNKQDKYGNQKLISVGFENQSFQLLKQDKVIKLNMFGLTLGTYDKFEELYKFMMRTKYTV